MKLNPDSIKEIDNAHPIELFRRGINDDETLSGYTSILKNALCTALKDVLHGTYEERAAEFVKIGKEDPIMARSIILHLVAMWCEQARLEPSDSEYMSPWTIRVNLNTIKNLFDMNDVAFAWRRAYEMCPEKRYCSPNPGWTSEEIREMLQKTTSSLTRAAILIMASSGGRRSSLELKWDDIAPVCLKGGNPVAGEDVPEMGEPACAMICMYRGEPEEYVMFITQEAYKALMEYKAEWEEEVGRPPGPEDPVFKKRGREPIPLRHEMIAKRVRVIAKKAGVQRRSDGNGKLHKVPLSNGFRRMFNKVMTNRPTDGTLRDS